MADNAQDRAARVKRRKAQEDRNLFARIQAASMSARAQSRKFLQHGGGISVVEWRVLWDVKEAGPLTIQDIAAIQRTDHSLISRVLPSMSQKGLVTMTRGVTDKRETQVEITDAGRAAFDATAPIMQSRRDLLLSTFTAAELETFIALFDRFDAYLEASVAALPEYEGASS